MSGSFGLSLINPGDNRAFRSGGMGGLATPFRGSARLLQALGRSGLAGQSLPAGLSEDEKPFSFSSGLRAGSLTLLELGTPLVGPGSRAFHSQVRALSTHSSNESIH